MDNSRSRSGQRVKALAVGGDFVADAASVACDLLTADGLLATCQTDNAWDGPWLRSELLDAPPDLATVNYHANHFSFGAPAGHVVPGPTRRAAICPLTYRTMSSPRRQHTATWYHSAAPQR